ncbi:13E12 repeat family protein [Gordonia sp. HY442]|uniref:DUF222 domain-containing protein n=1 Tax=Gordonia zhenghanii TaxID=2911516 RepID=UPI001F4123FD|nr:DUF222 domain-containing protein [Gordonia zhenghanii]MCF8607596.1 13E12 repeat family protein [Gordonia zhenghanii]
MDSMWSKVDLSAVGVGRQSGGALINALQAGEGLLMFLRWQAIYAMLTAAAGESGVALDAVDRRVVDVFASVSREVAIALRIAASTADRQAHLAVEAFERLPQVARLMRDGVISVAAFGEVMLQTTGVEDADMIAAVDATTAADLREFGGVSRKDASDVARRAVAELDPDGLRARREARGKGVTVSTDVDGADVLIATTVQDAAVIDASIDAVADSVCADDTRTRGIRRHDAAVALLTRSEFGCSCGNPECTATASAGVVADRFASVVVHVVADASTLSGESEKAGWLDGFGVLDAHHVREIAARTDAVIRPLDIAGLADRAARAGDPYRPTTACDTAVRAVFGTCSEPGCARPAWRCDLDHVCEFDHDRPAAGGATCVCNLNPKCRFHNRRGQIHIDDRERRHVPDHHPRRRRRTPALRQLRRRQRVPTRGEGRRLPRRRRTQPYPRAGDLVRRHRPRTAVHVLARRGSANRRGASCTDRTGWSRRCDTTV